MLGIVLALKLPTILILAWVFLHPEESFHLGRRYWGVFTVVAVHILLALLSLTGEKSSLSEMFIAYPLIWSVLLRDRLRRLLPPQAAFWLMGVVICLLLWFEETWVIVDHRSPPLRHYIHYFGFYLGVTATIVWLYRRYRFSVLADLPGRRVMGRARRATICRSQDASRREGCRSNRLRSLYRSRLRALPCSASALVLRGVQRVKTSQSVARSLVVLGNIGPATCHVVALVSTASSRWV